MHGVEQGYAQPIKPIVFRKQVVKSKRIVNYCRGILSSFRAIIEGMKAVTENSSDFQEVFPLLRKVMQNLVLFGTIK